MKIMKKPITIRWLGNPAPCGNMGLITVGHRFGIRSSFGSGGFWGLYMVLTLLVLTPGSTIFAAVMPDPNQLESAASAKEVDLLDELRSLVQTLRQARTAFYERQRKTESRIERKRADLASLESRVAELRSAEEEIDRDLAQIEQEMEQLGFELQTNETHQAQLAENMDAWIRKGLRFVDEGIPYRREERRFRLSSVEEEGSERESVTAADTLGWIWSFFQEEMRIARTGETFTKQMDVGDNRIKYAQMFRVGHQVLGYLTEDGQQTGMWIFQDGRKQWKHHLQEKNSRSIQTAVEILDRRQEPELVPLPISALINHTAIKIELEPERSSKK